MKIKNLQQVLPILGFDEDILVSKSLDMTIGLRLQLPELFLSSSEQLYQLHDTFKRLVNILPAKTLIHKQDYFLKETFSSNLNSNPKTNPNAGFKPQPITESLTDNYLHHFSGRDFLRHECYLFISLLSDGLLANFLGSSLIYSPQTPRQLTLQKEKIEEVKVNVMGQLNQAGILCELMNQEELARLMERYLTLHFNDATPQLGSIDFRDHLKVMDNFVEIYSLSDFSHLPSEVMPVGKHPGTGLPVSMVYPVSYDLHSSHITNQFIFIPDQNSVKTHLESSHKKIFSLSKFSTENRVNAGLIGRFLEQVQQSGEKIVRSHFNLMLFDDSLSSLRQQRSEATTGFARMNCFPYRHTHDLPMMFFAAMPASTQLPESELFITQVPQACCFTNFEGATKNSTSGFTLYFSDRLNGCPVKVDISDEPMALHRIHNRNKIIIGGSGSGKSFLTNHLLRGYAENGAKTYGSINAKTPGLSEAETHIVLLDVGRSYQLLVKYLQEHLADKGGAMLVEFTRERPISFNPFVLSGELTMEHKQTILSILCTIYKSELTGIEKDVIAHSVTAFFKEPREDYSFNGYYRFCQKWLPVLVKDKDLAFNASEFFFILSKYFEGGEYDYLLNKQMKTDLFFDCPFIVFELDNIKDHPVIFPVATLIIIDIFMQKMRRLKGIRKVICIEEAWKAIATPQMADYIKYFFKTIRKFFGEAIVVTQEIEDIISSPIIRDAIINNADTKILLDMSKFSNKFERISQVLGLNDFQKEQILSVNKNLPAGRKLKEVFIGLGSYSRVFGLEVSRPEYYCYTSEQKEKEWILSRMNDNQSFLQTLQSL